MHVRTVQSFQVNTLHTVVSFHSTPPSRSRKSPRVRLQEDLCPRHVSQSGSATSSVPEPLRPPAHRDAIVRISRRRDFPHVHHHPHTRSDQDQIRQGPLPPEGGSLDSKTYIFHHANVVGSVRPRWRLPAPPASRILAFRPECNPPARTTPASRTACDCKHFSPSPSTRGTVRQYSRRRWRTSWGRPGGAWHQQRTLLPVPLYARSGSTTLKAPPPAKPLRARVTRCGHPRIGTRPTNHVPRANAGD